MRLATTVNPIGAHGRVKVFSAEDAEFMPRASPYDETAGESSWVSWPRRTLHEHE